MWIQRLLTGSILALSLSHSAVQAGPVNKCVIGGITTYQQAPCPAPQRGQQPTIAQLNAAEVQRRAVANAASAASAASAPLGPMSGMPAVAARAPDAAHAKFSCDGRQYCSQMRSCDEARFFLAHCPGVRMDGDHNGTPCEKQWCGR